MKRVACGCACDCLVKKETICGRYRIWDSCGFYKVQFEKFCCIGRWVAANKEKWGLVMYENIAIANINREVNGIELTFPAGKPEAPVLAALRDAGFRWHNKKKVWYARNTADHVRAVEGFVDLGNSDPSFGITPNGTVDIEEIRKQRSVSLGQNLGDGGQGRRLGARGRGPGAREGASEFANSDAVSKKLSSEVGHKFGADKAQNNTKKEKGSGERGSVGASAGTVKPACIADFYQRVGNSDICRDSTTEGALWSSSFGSAYYSDINAYIAVKLESAYVVELDNAMKRGKTCKVYSIYAYGKDMRLYLANECGVRTPKDLYNLVRSGRELPGNGRLSVREDKGVDVFSPFIPIKPLKEIPEKWRKGDLVRAIMSGQVYSGTWKEYLTDDYGLDAARGFLRGKKVDLPEQAQDLVENCRDPYIKTKSMDAKGMATVSFSYVNEAKTFLFDLNCDLAQSMERQRAADWAVKEHNERIKASIVKLSPSDIDEGKVYVVDRVVEDENTGKLGVAPEILQGFVLMELLDYGATVGGITGVKEAELVPGRLYEVANYSQRRQYADPDDRIVDMGNWQQLASGKAVKELTEEGIRLKMSIGGYERPRSFVQAKRTCMEHLAGTRFWGPGVCKVDYTESLEKLENEEARIARDRLKTQPSLESMIENADRNRVARENSGLSIYRSEER